MMDVLDVIKRLQYLSAKIAALVMISAFGGISLSAARAEMFDETAARSVCENAANKSKDAPGLSEQTNKTIRNAVIEACVGTERRIADTVEYKRSLMPRHIYNRCNAATNGSYSDANECLDKALLSLPLGTVRGIWQFHKDGQVWVFWTLEDCTSARTTAGGGVCISN
jgi:hypothetical protein